MMEMMTNEIQEGSENRESLDVISKSPEAIFEEENLLLEKEISEGNEWFSNMDARITAYLKSIEEEGNGQFASEISAIAKEANRLNRDYDPNAPIPLDFIPAEHICKRCGQKHSPDQPCPKK